jgi:hypothetical protein
MGCCEEQPLLSFIEQAKNVTDYETVVTIEVNFCGHKTIDTCSCTKNYVLSSDVYYILFGNNESRCTVCGGSV